MPASGVGTAYGPPWDGPHGMEGGGTTSTGVPLSGRQVPIVAADPYVYPYGTLIRAWPNPFGDPNKVFVVGDTGGAFYRTGTHNIDFFVSSGRKGQNQYGRRPIRVQVVGKVGNAAPGQKVPASVINQALDKLSGATPAVPAAGTVPPPVTPDPTTPGASSGLGGIGAIGAFFATLLNPNTWLRILLFVVGLLAVGLAGYSLMRK